jgi:uncharacterized protein YjhX (UPF0386 family)
MIYEVYFSVGDSISEEIEAKDEVEANTIADKIKEKLRQSVAIKQISGRVTLSEKNFCLIVGGIYLIRRYKSQVPAICKYSRKGWHYKADFEHEFKYLDTPKAGKNEYFRLFGDKPERVIKLLCNNGEIINKPECKECVARFSCYTKKGTE